ncbi:MAG: hypothetical protein F4206_03420 [Gammaproteobacteria bacterium]|nr:hypothetical protein [Gammaproteobacteria bacterium]
MAADLEGCEVAGFGCDGYKHAEVLDFLDRADVAWTVEARRVGAGRDGGQDVRRFQRLVHNRQLVMEKNLSLSTAISQSTLKRDSNGNPGLDKANSRGRIDVLSAAVIACGMAEPYFDRDEDPGFRMVQVG